MSAASGGFAPQLQTFDDLFDNFEIGRHWANCGGSASIAGESQMPLQKGYGLRKAIFEGRLVRFD